MLEGRLQEIDFHNNNEGTPPSTIISATSQSTTDPADIQVTATQDDSENDGEAIYTKALQLYNTGNYKQAIEYFQLYLKKYADQSHAGDANYWLAECHYSLDELDAALDSFEMTAARYPAHKSAPNALLKASIIYEEKGEKEKVLELLKKIEINHPNYEQMDRVKAKIAELNK